MKKERPILFSTPMVQAIMAGRKTMTRRLVKPQPADDTEIAFMPNEPLNWQGEWCPYMWMTEEGESVAKHCPYGQPGDLLWVREKFTIIGSDIVRGGEGEILEENHIYCFKGQKLPHIENLYKWKPSIHLPKAAARIWLEVINVRAERLQDITEEDAIAEGVEQNRDGSWHDYIATDRLWQDAAKPSFISLWMKINGDESWKANSWVWVVSFKIISTTGKPKI